MMGGRRRIAPTLLVAFVLSGESVFVSPFATGKFPLPHHSKLRGDCNRIITSIRRVPIIHPAVVHRQPLNILKESVSSDEEISYAENIRNTIFYILIAVIFGAFLWLQDSTAGEEFFAGYIVEKSLSVDNLFVFLLLFDFFKVPDQYQGRILNWGIAGSVVMRAIMISLGAVALENFHEVLLVFAAILIYSAAQVLYDVEDEDEEDLNANPVIQLSKNLFPSTDVYDGDRFFTFEDGVKKATPLFICMVAVELSDVVFAVDSIPAVFGVTENPLIVFSSNMFAILGLRQLYPILSKAASDLKYLEPAVAVILAFIGGKMIAEYFGYALPTEVALAVIVSLLGLGVGLSLREDVLREKSMNINDDD